MRHKLLKPRASTFPKISANSVASQTIFSAYLELHVGPLPLSIRLMYLGSMFPTIYDNKLTPNKTNATDPIDATNFGITGWTVGNNPMRLGFYNLDRPHNADFTDSFLNTKKDWFNDYAPGTTVFNSWFAGSADNNRTPTIADLAPEMQRGEDVELFVRGDADYYHVISLTGIFCSDDAMTRCGLRYQDNDGDLTQNLMADLTVTSRWAEVYGRIIGCR